MTRRSLLVPFAIILLVACGGQPAPSVQNDLAPVEITRLVEVTRLMEIEVTRLVEVVITASPPPTPVPSPTSEIDPTAYLAAANMSPDDLPTGDAGLVVIAAGFPSNFGVIPVVVRNNTDAPIYNLEISATARSADGSVLGTASGRNIAPGYVPPGGIAFGRVLFQDAPLDGATIEYLITGDDSAGTIFTHRDMEISEHNLVGGSVVGSLLNSNPTALDLINVAVICFDDTLTPTTARDDYTDQDRVEAGAEVPFSVDLLGDAAQCGRYLLAGGGWEAD